MIKINFIGQKDSGKSLSCYIFASLFKKEYKTIILNFDYFNKYKEIINKDKINKKNQIIHLEKNFDILNFDLNKLKVENENIIDKVNQTLNDIEKEYEVILIDLPIAFGELNLSLLKDSNLIICPFKIEEDILEYKNKILKNFLKYNIKFKNFKFLPILTSDSFENFSIMIKLKKQLLDLMFDKHISYHQFKKYSDLIENQQLINEYIQIYENIKKIILI